MTVNDRMKLVREEAGDNFTQCGEKIGISRSAVSMIESGTNNPSRQTVELFCREYGVNRDWLETGEGERNPLPTTEFDEILAELVEQAQDRVTRESLEKVLRWYLELDVTGREFLFQIIKTAVEATKKDPE